MDWVSLLQSPIMPSKVTLLEREGWWIGRKDTKELTSELSQWGACFSSEERGYVQEHSTGKTNRFSCGRQVETPEAQRYNAEPSLHYQKERNVRSHRAILKHHFLCIGWTIFSDRQQGFFLELYAVIRNLAEPQCCSESPGMCYSYRGIHPTPAPPPPCLFLHHGCLPQRHTP